MRALSRDFDWSTTSLGPVPQWPQSLRTVTQLVLASPLPTVLLWGPQLIQLYNDGYRELMGNKHPAGLGQPTGQCWPEVWHINEPIYRRVWAGESFSFDDALYPINRSGQLQNAWFTLAYSPVLDETGKVGGILVTVFETTESMLEQRYSQQVQLALAEQEKQQAFLLTLSDALRPLSDPVAVQQTAMQVLGEYLQVNRAFYSELLDDDDTLLIGMGYAHQLSALDGSVSLAAFDSDLVAYYRAGQTVVIHDLYQDIYLSAQAKAAFDAIHVRAVVGVPLVKAGKVRAILSLHQAVPRQWTHQEITLLEETAERTWAAVERAKAEEALRQSEDRLRTVLEGIDEPFYALDRDWRFLFVSRSALHLWDKAADQVLGRSLLEAFPQVAGSQAYEAHRRVMHTGTPERLETISPVVNRWVEINFAPTQQGGLSVAFRDIQAHKQAEQKQVFLLKLSDALRSLSDSAEMELTAIRLLGQELGVNRAFFATIDVEGEAWTIQHDYADGVDSMAGRYPMSEFQRSWLPQWQAGRMSSIADSETDPKLSTTDRAAYTAFDTRAVIGVPLVKGGRFAALLSISQCVPRVWTEEELALTSEVAERIWAAVEGARAKESLRQSEEKYRSLFNSIDQGYCLVEVIVDEAGKVVDLLHLEVNQAYERQTGLSDIVGKWALEISPTGEEWLDFYGNVALTGQSARMEYEVSAIGRWISAYASRVGGVGSRWVAIVFDDITERKRREANLTFLAEISQDLARLTNIDDTLNRLSSKIGAHFKAPLVLFAVIDETEEVGTVTHEWHRADLPSPMGVHRFSTHYTNEFRQTLRSGQTYVVRDASATTSVNSGSFVSVPIWREGRWRYLLSVMDSSPHNWREDEIELLEELTSRIWTRLERARSEDALKEADRRKDEFLAMLAHELRNPMSTIRSGLQVLSLTDGADQTTGPLSRSATIAMMNRQTDHLVRMVDDLLDVSRISQGKIELQKERVNLVELVSQARQSVQPQFEQQGKVLHVSVPPAPTTIELEGDATRLTQLVINLLTNGLRYTGEQGQVWLNLTHQNSRDGSSEQDDLSENHASPRRVSQQEAIIEVKDNGIGLAADQLESIFELFVQVDNSLARSKGGLGLGLTLVKRLVELHGGRVEAQSDGLGQGSTFTVHLPTLPAATRPGSVTTPQAADAWPLRRILVVDDNVDAAFTLAMLLKLKGYEVHTRHSGQAGIEAAEQLQPWAILLDIGMPELDGYATCRFIRQQAWGQDIVVIALTGYGQDEDRQRTREVGFDGHLVKPVDLEALLNLLTELPENDKTNP